MKITTAIATAALALMAAPSFALTVAVLDAQYVINNSNAGKRVSADLAKQRESAQAKLKALEAPLQEKYKKLLEQRSVMAPDKLKAAEDEIKKDATAFRTQAQTLQEGFESANLKGSKEVIEGVRKVVEAIAKEKSYDIVLPKSAVHFNGPNVPDITQETLTRTNAALK